MSQSKAVLTINKSLSASLVAFSLTLGLSLASLPSQACGFGGDGGDPQDNVLNLGKTFAVDKSGSSPSKGGDGTDPRGSGSKGGDGTDPRNR